MDLAGGDVYLGIEIGGTKLQLGLGRGDGHLLALERRKIEPALGAPAILAQLQDGYRALLESAGLNREAVRAAGIGFGGPVDAERGRVRTSFQVEGWTDFPLVGWIRDNLALPAAQLENDADTAGLAEATLGAGVGHSPLIYMTIGSGVGGALILDGRIYRGCGLGALEIGHVRVPAGRDPGGLAELEQIASGWGIARQAREHAKEAGLSWVVVERVGGNPDAITTEMVARAAREGDRAAQLIFETAHRALAHAICQAIALLGPRRVILGGGVSLIGEDLWFQPVRRLVGESVFAPFRDSFDIVPPDLGEEVVVHGALALARDAASRYGPSPA